MSLIKGKSKAKSKAITVRMPEDVEAQATAYAEFMREEDPANNAETDRNHVIVEAVQFVIGRDKKFQAWHAARRASRPVAVDQGAETKAPVVTAVA